jgi:hypothetical protein
MHLTPPAFIQLIATDTLIKSTFLFLIQHGIELHHDVALLLLRELDYLLMPTFFDFSPTDDELLSLNRCRLFLQVLFLSEICTGDGLAISEDAWRGTRFEVPSKTLSWPRQQ